MGLDQNAFAISRKPEKPINFQIADDETHEELQYWRKHPNLHGWMQRLYVEKGGDTDPSNFNVVNLELTAEDLDRLEKDVREGNLPATQGFFFGSNSDDYYREQDLAFITKARAAIEEGKTVCYSSWW